MHFTIRDWQFAVTLCFRVVHPDKVSCESVEIQALAQQIFTVLTEAMQNLK
jgi:hypothetical protein